MKIAAVNNEGYLVQMTARERSHLAGLEKGHDFPVKALCGARAEVLPRTAEATQKVCATCGNWALEGAPIFDSDEDNFCRLEMQPDGCCGITVCDYSCGNWRPR